VASISNSRALASRLAETAGEIRDSRGDLCAQSLVYGAFLERMGVSGLSVIVESEVLAPVSRVLDKIDIGAVFAGYLAEGKDPGVYFYEEFLRAYDARGARTRGVHYSPPAVVSYMVRGVESILGQSFGERLDQAVVLDPCCGAGTFLRYIETNRDPLPRMIGTELMEPAFGVASRLLRRSEALHADSLDDIDLRLDGRTLVVLGNPPYSGHSANAGRIADLMADYRAGLEERNPKWLQDDYVKFIRMAQHRVDSAGRGIVAFITNHSYLFNPTFRAMRASLMRSFDAIYTLDLHGNSKQVERTETSEPDENVFSIQMGVAITFMVKTGEAAGCRVHYADLRGSRESKLKRLSEMGFEQTPWNESHAGAPFVLFTPHDSSLQEEYAGFASLSDVFVESSVGFVTSRDRFAVDVDRAALIERLEQLADVRLSHDELHNLFPIGDLDIDGIRREMAADPEWRSRVVEVTYRPFDRRWAYLSRAVMERPRLPFMDCLRRPGNVALAVGRAGQVTGSSEWDVVFCTDCPADLNLFRRGGAMLFPKYVCKGEECVSNMKPTLGDPDRLFGYIYAILHSRIYRARYADFLGVDYPRVPIASGSLFDGLAQLGQELMSVHLMREGAVREASQRKVSMTIGGYDLPRRYVEGRGGEHAGDLARVEAAVACTMEIRERIDELVRREPPWRRS